MQHIRRVIRRELFLGAALLAGLASTPANATEPDRQKYVIQAPTLGEALQILGSQSGRDIMFPSAIETGRPAPHLDGTYSFEEAVGALLAGSGLRAEFRDGAALIRGREAAGGSLNPSALEKVDDIRVTGTRIRSAQPSSPTITLQKSDIINAGQSNLDEAMRSLPQNFGGGQNPAIGNGVPETRGSNIGSGSAINLRGLGQDATLTLLNGHRLAYNSAFQGVDISAIPLAAVERVDIVVDGASAVYGSDAVAGVANILLKRDFDGLATSARLGTSTSGGNSQQQYSAVGGTVWNSGGILAAYDYAKTSPISAGERSVTQSLNRETSLHPPLEKHSLLLSGHQQLSAAISFDFDATYNHRASGNITPFSPILDVYDYGNVGHTSAESFSVAPSVDIDLGDWSAALSALYAQDNTDYGSFNYVAPAAPTEIAGNYKNRTRSVELSAQGGLFALPAGDVRIAIGMGLRKDSYESFRLARPKQIVVSQRARYAFAEAYIPVAASESSPLLHRIALTLAARYEDYPGIDSVAVPKLGLIYEPSPSLALTGSWGRSFKAPQFYQQYLLQNVSVYQAAAAGGTAYPPTATILYRTGGNPDIGPERARSLTLGARYAPTWLDGARIEASYFNIRYSNRVVEPIAARAQALINPAYASLVTLNPGAGQASALLAGADRIYTYVGPSIDPSKVVAIIDARYVNAQSQTLSGFDLSGRYRFDLADTVSMTLVGSGAYMKSRQRLADGLSEIQMAGTIFNPPHFRGRLGAIVEAPGLSASIYANHIGGVEDKRFAVVDHVRGMTTFDVTFRFVQRGETGLLNGIEATLTAQNLFNRKPDKIVQPFEYTTPYDTTNYSIVGRFVGATVTKRW